MGSEAAAGGDPSDAGVWLWAAAAVEARAWARQLLAVNPQVVADQANYPSDSSLWQRERRQLAEAIMALNRLPPSQRFGSPGFTY